jgi:hypothetical protein
MARAHVHFEKQEDLKNGRQHRTTIFGFKNDQTIYRMEQVPGEFPKITVANRLVLSTRNEAKPQDKDWTLEAIEELGGEIQEATPLENTYLVHLPDFEQFTSTALIESIRAPIDLLGLKRGIAIRSISADPVIYNDPPVPGVLYDTAPTSQSIEVADPHYRPCDPLLSKQWALRQIEAPTAWQIAVQHSIPKVALIDSGVFRKQLDLTSVIDCHRGYDFVHNRADSTPDGANSHGTMCAGIIGAGVANRIGIAGICPKVSIIPIKVIGDSFGTCSAAARGIRHALNARCQVLNCSWRMTCDQNASDCLTRVIEDHVSKDDCIIVFSAGNDGLNLDEKPEFPACYSIPNKITACGTTVENVFWGGQRDTFCSNFGEKHIEVGAPALNIYVTNFDPQNGSSWLPFSGTSFAAAHVSGIAAYLKSSLPQMKFDELKSRIIKGAVPAARVTGGIVWPMSIVNLLKSISLQ